MDDLLNVYIHIDMDAYYAQAESKLLNIDPEKPLCARQWNSLIVLLEIMESKEECQQKKLKNYIHIITTCQESKKIFQVIKQFALLLKKNSQMKLTYKSEQRNQDFKRDESKANLIIKQPEGYCLSKHDRMIINTIYSQSQYKYKQDCDVCNIILKAPADENQNKDKVSEDEERDRFLQQLWGLKAKNKKNGTKKPKNQQKQAKKQTKE